MDNEKPKKKLMSTLSIKSIIIFITLNLIFVFGATICFYNFLNTIELQKAVDRGIIVEAEIASLDYTQNSSGSEHTYTLVCRYIDENGIVYEGECARGSSANPEQEKNDEKRIGEKVYVYLGNITNYGKGTCWAISYGKDVKAWTYLICACIFIFLILFTIVLLIVYLLLFYDKLSFKKKLNDNASTNINNIETNKTDIKQ